MSDPSPPDMSTKLIKPAPRVGFFQRMRNNFLTGIVVSAPFAITLYLTWTLIDYVDGRVLPLIPAPYRPDQWLPFAAPGLGLIVLALFLIIVGSLTKNFFGRELVRISERWVDQMPVIRSVYNALKQIAETIFTQSSNSFERACLVEYPRKGIWAVAFVSTHSKGEVPQKARDGQSMMSVFLPTTPNPTSGFLLFVPEEDVILLDMSVEEAAKLVISAGLVVPPTAAEKAALAPLQLEDGAGGDPGLEQRPYTGRSAARRELEGQTTPAEAAERAARNPLSRTF
ncbi:MAG: DUF502 domain-containing protein [Pseudomonadota bacterium]